MKKIHFIGIGGIGISALAAIYLEKGLSVQGSDLKESSITQNLKQKGVKVFIGQKSANISKDIDQVIYSTAVPDDNPELKKARQLDLPCQTYPQALGELTKNYFAIAVSGMHGKSTTASMLAQILIKADLDPSFVIGAKPNYRVGKSKYLVIEACEYRSAFLNYHPNILILTNIEEEHLDYFKNLDNILTAFGKYVSQVKDLIIANGQDKNIKRVIKQAKCSFKLIKPEKIKLRVPGAHNQLNAALALAAAQALSINKKIGQAALEEFSGIWRRFEEKSIKIKGKQLTIISDYAHHPTEIKATLQAAHKKYPNKKIVAIFQPHQYHRLAVLFEKFSKSFSLADQIIITDVFKVAGRQTKIIKKSQDLAEAIPGALYLPFNSLKAWIIKQSEPGKVIILMGAGSINKIFEQLVNDK